MKIAAAGLAAVFILGGCAAQNIIIHRMPNETPAADNAAAIQTAAALAEETRAAAAEVTRAAAAEATRAAASTENGAAARQEGAAAKQGGAAARQEGAAATQEGAAARREDRVAASEQSAGEAQAPPLTPADAPPQRTYDPWERFNRFNYRFNARFDESVFLPISNGYRRLPSQLRSGVHNFFGNLSEVDSVINYSLQGRLRRGVRSLGRFVINSTVGLGGLFDVATKFHLDKAPTGFGTTLSKWGMHPGPFLVIPILGPSTLREAVGLLGDYGASYGVNLANLYRGNQSWALGMVNAVDQRSNISFRYYSTGSPFEYETIRFLYVRKLLLEDEGLHKKERRKPRAPDLPAGQ